MSKPKRVAIYVRVSTDAQNTKTQRRELEAWAKRAGHTVVCVYEDAGISGAKGRDQRPQFDALLKAAVRREFNMLAVWSSDRLGRSLKHLVEVLEIIRDTGTGLYIHTQSVDTTTPAGRAMFGMLGIFSEFEREMIVARVNAGLARARDAIARDGHFISRLARSGSALGVPTPTPKKSKLLGVSSPRAQECSRLLNLLGSAQAQFIASSTPRDRRMHEAADAHERSADICTTIEAMRPTTNDLTGRQDTAPAQGWQNPREMASDVRHERQLRAHGQAADRRGWACNCSRQQWHRPEIRAAAATESGIGENRTR